jgi:Prp8 binding protein
MDAALVPAAPSAKRQRVDQQQLVAADSRALAGLEAGTVPRTSSLDAPTMLLHGHGDCVSSVKISPQGNVLASGSNDKTIFLWNVRGDCQVRATARVARARTG